MHNLPHFESHTFIEWVAFVYTFWCYFCFRPAAIILLTNVFLYSKLSNIRTFHKIYNSLICQSISIFLSKWLIFNNNYICRIACDVRSMVSFRSLYGLHDRDKGKTIHRIYRNNFGIFGTIRFTVRCGRFRHLNDTMLLLVHLLV